MFLRVLRFVRLPLLLLVLFTIGRFYLGLRGVPYGPRGTSVFSIVTLSYISCLYYGAISNKVGNFSWLGTILIGVIIGIFAQLLIFTATFISYAGGYNTSYFLHWDALNLPEGSPLPPMQDVLKLRAGAILFFPITTTIATLIGRLLGFLAPEPPKRY